METPADAPIVPASPTPSAVVEGTLSVVISVTAHGRPEDAEVLAEAALKAARILVPIIKGGSA